MTTQEKLEELEARIEELERRLPVFDDALIKGPVYQTLRQMNIEGGYQG